MAKLTKCELCGKEITKGLFKGEDQYLEIASFENITCCDECYSKYKKLAKEMKENFTVKLANYKWATKRKPKGAELAELYLKYINEVISYTDATKNEEITGFGGFYTYNDNGVFGWTERQIGFMGSDISTKDKIKALDKNLRCEAFCFTKNDVSCIQYRLCERQELSLFKTAYSVEICLNRTKELTFKPCYGKTVVIASGWFGLKKKARRQVVALLEEFKQNVGCNFPITEVKKFK